MAINREEINALLRMNIYRSKEELRTQLLTDLTARNQYDLLTGIYLDEGEIDHALEVVKHTRISSFLPAFWCAVFGLK